jgi:5-formaminoimidazole-4-carboxamide-1-beta-D-ribofuranosyl 5'-monophosphate synthetase
MSPVKVVKSGGECPICKRPLENGVYTGKKNFVLNRYSSDYERDSMQDLVEDGLVVWYVVPKRSRESYAGGSNVKNGFVVRFAGGSYE